MNPRIRRVPTHQERWLTPTLILENKLPGQEVALDVRKLAPPKVQVILPLPEVPPLLDLPDLIALAVLHDDGAVDEVHRAPHPEDDLLPCAYRSTPLCMHPPLAMP